MARQVKLCVVKSRTLRKFNVEAVVGNVASVTSSGQEYHFYDISPQIRDGVFLALDSSRQYVLQRVEESRGHEVWYGLTARRLKNATM